MGTVFDFSLVAQNWEYLAQGLWITVSLVTLSLVIGFFLTIPMAIARANKHPIFNPIVWGYAYFFRGTPLLVQTYLIYYGLGQFDWAHNDYLWPILREGYWCALIAFTLNTIGYQVEILRGAIEATPFGEIEAAKACGMSPWKRMRRIILPSALRRAMPAYSNEVIFMLHGSAIASTVTVIDILGGGKVINGKYYTWLEGYLPPALMYLTLVFLITRVFKLLEKRFHAHLRPREVDAPQAAETVARV